jgi:hypothetical protein
MRLLQRKCDAPGGGVEDVSVVIQVAVDGVEAGHQLQSVGVCTVTSAPYLNCLMLSR